MAQIAVVASGDISGHMMQSRARSFLHNLFGVFLGLMLVLYAAQPTFAGSNDAQALQGEEYVPTIWVDPDGCEHWVFDDGLEGYMSPHLTRDGKPVCRTQKTCAVLNSDQLFATNRAAISSGNRKRLIDFFKNAPAKSFIVAGHTDDRASEGYNQRLSERRAKAVAKIANDAGVQVLSVRGYGETYPKASNDTAAGRAENRRVELICVY